MRFTLALTTILGASFASAAAICSTGSAGNGGDASATAATANVVDSGNVVNSGNTVDNNSGNQCPQSHPVASCCNSNSAGLLGFLDAGSLGCAFNVLQSDCNQQTYCCQNNNNVALVDVGCINFQLF